MRQLLAALPLIAVAGLLLASCQSLAGGAPDEAIDELARDVERLESLRAVKDLQRSYAQHGQFALWDEMASLFSDDASFYWGDDVVEGRAAIGAWLTHRGGGQAGLAPGALRTEFIDEPLINLSVDGNAATGRWMSLSFLGDGEGAASIEGGIYENEYVREGAIWKISTSHFYPHYAGSYEAGWRNWRGEDLPRIPYHFTVDETGVPIPPPVGPAPASGALLEELETRIAVLNDEDAVRNLQNAYGYYVDRKMWDDVVDLFVEDSALEIADVGVFLGRDGVRRAMERMGPAELSHGELNDHPLFDTMVRVLPGGREAVSRGIELAMLGDADETTAQWGIAVFRNRFVKEDGLWKFKEMRFFPTMRADYFVGWGQGALAEALDETLPAPDRVASDSRPERWAPAYIEDNPVTGQPVDVLGMTVVGGAPLLGAIAPDEPRALGGSRAERLAEARRGLARSSAYDGTVNISAAYGYYLDDFQWPKLGGIFAVEGNKQSPFAGFYFGRDRIQGAATAMWGEPPELRSGVAFHWRTQPVIHVAADGRSTNLRTRLLQPRTFKGESRRGAFFGAGFMGGMYPNDQTVLEDGIWRFWSLTIDEPYFTSVDWSGGWTSVEAPEPGAAARVSPLLERYPPDLAITELGLREEHFRGGTGETINWPGILPMWFHYRNPVSGRTPARYWPDCVPCEMRPEVRMTNHGYLMPPTGPDPD